MKQSITGSTMTGHLYVTDLQITSLIYGQVTNKKASSTNNTDFLASLLIEEWEYKQFLAAKSTPTVHWKERLRMRFLKKWNNFRI